MNVLLWILQAALALLYGSGGAYKLSSAGALAGQFQALPRGAWSALGVLELLGAVLLVVPAALKWRPELTPIAAAALAVEALVLAAIYARTSLEVTATNPLVWSLAMGLLAAFVAYGRFALSRIG
jgi:hypothetical protein